MSGQDVSPRLDRQAVQRVIERARVVSALDALPPAPDDAVATRRAQLRAALG